MGLFAVIGPSRKEKRGPPRFLATRRAKTCSRSQNSNVARATAMKSSGPGVVNMLASGCSLGRPGSGDHLRAEVALGAETKRPPGHLTAVGYAKALRDRQLTQFSVSIAGRLIRNID